jgi:hypothetical protein
MKELVDYLLLLFFIISIFIFIIFKSNLSLIYLIAAAIMFFGYWIIKLFFKKI